MWKLKSDNEPASLKQRWQKVRRRALIHTALIALGLGFGFYFLGSSQIALLERQAFGLKSHLFAIWHQEAFKAARDKIVLVTLDENTLKSDLFKEKVTSPLPRRYHARVIRELKRLGARGIVFDLAFDEATTDDVPLIEAARDFKRIVWATYWQPETADLRAKMVFPIPALAKIGLCGHPRIPNSSDSFEDEAHPNTDRMEVFVPTERGPLAALSVQAARLITKEPAKLEESAGILKLGTRRLSLDENGEFRIIFSAAPKEGFPFIPYEEVWNGVQNNVALSDGTLFKDRIVFIGDTSELNKDIGYTPNGRMSGVEIHAHALATLLQNNLVHDARPSFNGALVILMVIGFWVITLLVPMRFYLPTVGVSVLAFTAFNLWVFLADSLNIALVAPAASALLISLLVLSERGWTTEGESRRLNTVLDQYVSPQVAQSGAPRGEVTLVFTDIEGSSAMSEKFGAAFERARDAHFELLREAAKKWNGFEVETAGDSLFVVFADSADAVRFAVSGQLALKNHRWPSFLREQHGDDKKWSGGDLPVRMGIHTGRPFIRLDRNRLTYRGPATNRASRVMGAGHGGQILLSQTAREKVGESLKADSQFAGVWYLKRGEYQFKGIGQESLWEACHADIFDPPPRPLRDEIVGSLQNSENPVTLDD